MLFVLLHPLKQMKGDVCTDIWVCRSDLKTTVYFLGNFRKSDSNWWFCATPVSLLNYTDPWTESITLANIYAKGWLLAILMKHLHISSRKEKGNTEVSLSRIIFLFTWYLYVEFLRVGRRTASSVAELVRSDVSVNVLSCHLWTKKTMR